MKTFLNIALILALALSACSPSARLARLQKAHPEIFPDKIVIKDTIPTDLDSDFEKLFSKWTDNGIDFFGTPEDSARWFSRKKGDAAVPISVLVLPDHDPKTNDTTIVFDQVGGEGSAFLQIDTSGKITIHARPDKKPIIYEKEVQVIPKSGKINSLQIFLIGLGIMFCIIILIVVVRKFL